MAPKKQNTLERKQSSINKNILRAIMKQTRLRNLGIAIYKDTTVATSKTGDSLLKASEKYKNHPSMQLIRHSSKNE